MPYKFEKQKKKIPRSKDDRVKLTYEQRQEIKENKLGLSQRALAAQYNVSRRTVQFILAPEKLEENLKRRQERGGSMKYYNKDEHRDSMRKHRRKKKKLDDSGELIQ